MSYLYKYIGPATLDKVFSGSEHFTMKCSLPKDFNDPYELFLTLNFNEQPEMLAYYMDLVGELPQLPTTCFSRSPAVIPMWAHYAQNLEGFVIEIDEKRLSQAFPESCFSDIDYMDAPREGLTASLYRAFGTQKPRHAHFLRSGVFNSAYFTKTTCWSYENERRMVVGESEVRVVGGVLLMDAPNSCMNSIIAGPRASTELQERLSSIAAKIGCHYFQLKIGRSSAVPYFIGDDDRCYIYKDMALSTGGETCEKCNEPTTHNVKECSWCQIDESHRVDAARRNPYRMLEAHDLLQPYLENVARIDREFARKPQGL